MPPAPVQDLLPSGGGGTQRFEYREGVRGGEVVQLQLPDSVPGEVVRANERRAFSGDEDELEGSGRGVDPEKVPKKGRDLRVRGVDVIEHQENGNLRQVAFQDEQRKGFPSLRRSMKHLRERRPTGPVQETGDVPEDLVCGGLGPQTPPEDVDAAFESGNPSGDERGLPDPGEPRDDESAGDGVRDESSELLGLRGPSLEVSGGDRLRHVEDLPRLHAGLPVEDNSEVEPAPRDAREDVGEPRPAREEQRDLVQSSLGLVPLEIGDDDTLLLDLLPDRLRPPEPRLGEEVRDLAAGFPRDVDLRGLQQPLLRQLPHRPGDVRAPSPDRLRDPVLGRFLGRGIVLTDVASIEQIQKAAWRKRESEAHHTCGQFHRGLKSPGVDFGTMEGLTKKVSPSGQDVDKGWREAVRQSCASLRREGFSVSNAVGELRMRGTRRGGTLLAAKGPHVV